MTADDVSELKARFAVLDEGSLNALIERSIRSPDSLTRAAHLALTTLMAERNMSVQRVMRDQAIGRIRDERVAAEKREEAEQKHLAAERSYRRVFSWFLIIGAPILGSLSALNGYWETAALALALLSGGLWLLWFGD
jgi:hypothetical protein